MELVRFTTAGSVDDGKSTLIGRLLYDTGAIAEDRLAQISSNNENTPEWAFLADGLKSEREQGITIDVAHLYFSTSRRKFIIADTPGHIQYVRNMATGASNANLALILVDATKGIQEQTKRHAFIASLLQIPHLVFCINKMDLVDWNQAVFDQIRLELEFFSQKLRVKDIHYIPISALKGDNIVQRSIHMDWYEGPTLLYFLENLHISGDYNLRDLRFPIQIVLKPHQNGKGYTRLYAGKLVSGILRTGDEVQLLPSRFNTKITQIGEGERILSEARPPQSIWIKLEEEWDLGRGDMIVRPNNRPEVKQEFDAMIIWFNQDNALSLDKKYWIKHTTREAKCLFKEIYYKMDINTLSRNKANLNIQMNDIAKVNIKTHQPLFIDPYDTNRDTGSFIIIDPEENITLAAGMIV